MKVFYWTTPYADEGRRMYQVDTDQNYCAQVPNSEVGPDMLRAMIEDGFIEVTATTAYKMGFPS